MERTPATTAYLLGHCRRYPALQPGDLLKALHQSVFGCGHFVRADGDGLERLRRELNDLPPDSREVVLLRALGGLSFGQIGEIVGRSENAVRVMFYRAKRALAERLEKDG